MAEITLRAARAEDKPDVLAFCERASEEGDYVASAWDGWLVDASGALLVAEDAGRPVGIVHLRRLGDQEGWLEGLRVDPSFQRRGIGDRLVAAVVDAARERGAWFVRLFTSSDNVPAQRLFGRLGFEQVAQFVTYEAEAVGGAIAAAVAAGASLRSALPDELDALWAFLRASNLVPLNGGLLLDGWTARSITPLLMQERLEADRVRLLEEWSMIQGMAIVEHRAVSRRGPTLHVQYIDGTAEGIGRLALALRELAAQVSLDRVVISVPDVLILHDAMDGAGYTRVNHGEHSIWCYARRLRTQ
jgi:ribosomal protein S18 acetylase RimI-like enzyme